MSYLLKVYATLSCVGGVAVRYVDGDVVVVAVGKVDVSIAAVGRRRSNVVFVDVGAVDFDANVSVAQAIVKSSFYPSTSAEGFTKPVPSNVTTVFESKLFAVLGVVETKIAWGRE